MKKDVEEAIPEEVAPFVGAWIEIMKYMAAKRRPEVAPFVGAWIEIYSPGSMIDTLRVAPFVGAWIEMYWPEPQRNRDPSLPSWERGLKFVGTGLVLPVHRRSLRGSVD